jgi:hypothetical protein
MARSSPDLKFSDFPFLGRGLLRTKHHIVEDLPGPDTKVRWNLYQTSSDENYFLLERIAGFAKGRHWKRCAHVYFPVNAVLVGREHEVQ